MKIFLSLAFVWLFSAQTLVLAADDPKEPEVKIRVLDVGPDQAAIVPDVLGDLFAGPHGIEDVDTFRIGILDGENVAETTLDEVPDPASIVAALSDPGLGLHFPGTKKRRLQLPEIPGSKFVKSLPGVRHWNAATWRIKLVVARFVVNGTIAGLMIVAKNNAADESVDWLRVLATGLVHGSVNSGFQYVGSKVAEASYADLKDKFKGTFFAKHGFEMSFKEFLMRTQVNSWAFRVLVTIGSTLIYRGLDACFTGVMDTSLYVLALIAMNIEASLAPTALGLEMGGKLGPPGAKGLEARNTHTFDLQNFTVGVLFAAGLALSSKEMSHALGIYGLWIPIYSTIASGGFLWWLRNSRWVNPELVPLPHLAVRGFASAGKWVAGAARGIGDDCREKIMFARMMLGDLLSGNRSNDDER